jgi:putative phage-type endonuclease
MNCADIVIYYLIDDQFSDICDISCHNFRDKMQVEKLKKTKQFEQRTTEWIEIRKNLITATAVSSIIGSNKYGNRKSILKEKIGLTKNFTKYNENIEHGKCYEKIVCQLYNKKNNTTINDFGLIIHENIPFLGASPDGITDDGIMIEIKCPTSRDITGNIHDLKTTSYYVQIQVQLEVCNLRVCDFIEYKIINYSSYENFINDGETELCGANGMEKGIIGVMKKNDNGELLYFYPDIGSSVDKQYEYIKTKRKENEENYEYVGEKFWNVKFHSSVRIKRDKIFFSSIYNMLNDFWKEMSDIKSDMSLYHKKYEEKYNSKNIGFDDSDFL